MGVRSGKDGTITWAGSEVTPLLEWNFTDLNETKSWHSNASGGARQRLAGVNDSNGTFRLNDSLPASAVKGAGAELVMYDNEDIFTVTVIISNIVRNCNIDGDIVDVTVTWEGNGAVGASTGSFSP